MSRSSPFTALAAGLGLVGSLAVSLYGRSAAQKIAFSGKNIAQLEELTRKDSNEATLRYYLGLAYWSKSKFDQARQRTAPRSATQPPVCGGVPGTRLSAVHAPTVSVHGGN